MAAENTGGYAAAWDSTHFLRVTVIDRVAIKTVTDKIGRFPCKERPSSFEKVRGPAAHNDVGATKASSTNAR